MSLVGLEEAEKLSEKLMKELEKDLKLLTNEAADEVLKIKYLLGTNQLDKPATKQLLDRIRSRLTEADKAYRSLKNLPASSQPAAWMKQYEKQLQMQLSQKQALVLEAEVKAQQLKIDGMTKFVKKENEMAKEAALRQAYDDARKAGGILTEQFNLLTAQDVVRLNMKKAGSKTLGQYMETLYNTYGKAYKAAYIRAMSSNFTEEKIIEDLQHSTNITAGKARLLVRTESNAIFNDQIQEAIETNPLIKGYIFRATLDHRTSDICRDHDGEYFDKDQIEPGVNFPPLHPNCRSTVETVMSYDTKAEKERIARGHNDEWIEVPGGMTYRQFQNMVSKQLLLGTTE